MVEQREGQSDFRHYLATLLNWWWVLLIVPLAAGIFALVGSSQEGVAFYQATTRILVQRVESGSGDIWGGEQRARVYQELITEPQVLAEVVSRLNLQVPPQEVRGWVTASVVKQTPILEIIVRHPDSDTAANVANSITDVFITRTQENRLGEIARLQALAEARGIVDKGEILAQQLAAMGSLTVVRRATPSQVPVIYKTSNRARVAIALSFGIAVAVALALGMEYLADRIRSPERLESITGMEPLGVVPRWRGGESTARTPVFLQHGKSHYAEAYRQMVARLNAAWPADEHATKVLVVTSPGPDEGKTTTVVNLATAFAESGRNVILVDGDLWKPDIHRWFRLPKDLGLTNLLSDPDMDWRDVILDTQTGGLRVITSGPRPQKGGQLLSRGGVERVFDSLKQQCDIVVVDSPPFLALSDAYRLASYADGAIVVADANKTRTRNLKRALHSITQSLEKVQNSFVGVVLNRLQLPRIAYYGYYQYYYKSYDTNGDEPSESEAPTKAKQNSVSRLINALLGKGENRHRDNAPVDAEELPSETNRHT